MTVLTTFCNPDPHAVRIARELHQSENPVLTVLFGFQDPGRPRPRPFRRGHPGGAGTTSN